MDVDHKHIKVFTPFRMVVLYKDIAKTAENILKDDYDFSRKLKIKSTSSNGVTFTTEGEMNANKSILGKVSASFKHYNTGLHIKRLQVNTQGRLTAEAELVNCGCHALKLSAKTEDGSKVKDPLAKRVGVLGYEYVKDNFAVDGQLDIGKRVVYQSGIFQKDNYRIGAQVGFGLEKNELVDHNVAISYTDFEYAATLQTKNKFSSLVGSFHHRASLRTIYSALFNYDVKSGANTLTVGGRYLADPWTEYAGKVESNGHISLALIQKLRPFVSLATSTSIDAKNFDGDGHKFGIALTLG